MKKNLFLLGTFMSGSLVTANTLALIACQKKVSGNKTENEKDTIVVEGEKAAKVKTEIRNIIDDVITNPNADSDDEWIIKLNDGSLNNHKEIIKSLNKAVETIIAKDGENGQANIEQENLLLNPSLINKIKEKFASLAGIIKYRIEKIEEDLGISNFNINIASESIAPMLTALNGTQFMAAVIKLNPKSTSYALSNFKVEPAVDNIPDIGKIKIDLFKVKTDLVYDFDFGSNKKFDDKYKDTELLLTGDINNYKEINRFTQETISKLITKNEKIKNIKIFSDILEESVQLQKYDYIARQMDWDFSKKAVQDEIIQMQFEKLTDSKSELKDIIKDMKLSVSNLVFEIDPSHYMKFNNHDMNLKRTGKDNILIKTGKINQEKDDIIGKITEQFQYDGDPDSISKEWNGGKINKNFIEQVKRDSEGDNPRIKLSDYYGLENTDSDDMLIGYGTTTIRRAYYAGVPLAKLTVDTNLVSTYGFDMEPVYLDLKKYVWANINAIKDDAKLQRNSADSFVLQWRFGNEGEWDLIQDEITNSGDGTISFNWIMKNILFNKRILGKISEASLPDDPAILETAKTILNSSDEVKYFKSENTNKYLLVKEEYVYIPMILYIKYGPFTVYLSTWDLRTVWDTFPNDTVSRLIFFNFIWI